MNQDGGTADGVFLQYAEAQPLNQPLLFIEATPLSTFTNATDQQLVDRAVTRAQWTQYVDSVVDTRERQLLSGLGGSYKVELFSPGMAHGSFGDTPLSATTAEAHRQALHNLRLTVEVTRAFLDQYLKGEKATLLESPGSPEIKVRKYAP